MTISRVAIIGGGTMGSGIAEVCARSGLDTIVVEVQPDYAEYARERIVKSLDSSLSRERITAEERDEAVGNLGFTVDMGDLGDRDLVIEAVIESEDEKLSVFGRLDKVTPEHTILATNTSSIPIITISSATERPDRVLGMHFFNPAPVQPLVELVSSLRTSPDIIDSVQSFSEDVLGKHVIRCRDRAGFVVNRLLIPYLLSAITMADSGLIARPDIDAGMKYGCAHPMGPLELSDLIGLDTVMAVAEVLYEEFKEPLYAPPPLLRRMVAAGHLGRKSGQGFYEYA
ncbi:MAG: 3-hydroxybutyryl-CoA dehydrogenase [Acidimicrobiales bacterium]